MGTRDTTIGSFKTVRSRDNRMKSKCTWIIQTNLSQNGGELLKEACDNLGQPFLGIKVIPFYPRMQRLDIENPFVFMGSTTLNRNAYKSRKYRSGVFFNPDTFTPREYAAHYGHHYLNSGLVVTTLSALDVSDYPEDEILFIRSNDDSKNVSGGTCTFKELMDLKTNVTTHYLGGDIFGPNDEIVISGGKYIGNEWRLIIKDKKVLTGSQYRPSIEAGLPPEVEEFGNRMANIWGPHNIYVMDICICDGELKVVECNCFNGSGMYRADIHLIVKEISEYMEMN